MYGASEEPMMSSYDRFSSRTRRTLRPAAAAPAALPAVVAGGAGVVAVPAAGLWAGADDVAPVDPPGVAPLPPLPPLQAARTSPHTIAASSWGTRRRWFISAASHPVD